MAERKYERYVKKLKFKERGIGNYHQVTSVNGKEFGIDFNIEYGAYWAAGLMGAGKIESHKHDYNQIMFFLGADPDDMGELNAEIELCMGEENEKNRIVNTSAMAIPAGLPHFPSTIINMNKRFLYMEVSCSNKLKETVVPVNKDAFKASTPPVRCKYNNHMSMAGFIRKSSLYGPLNKDDHGGSLAFIKPNDSSIFEYLIMCENIKKAPYRFGWYPDRPHAHTKPEILNFIGTDLNDLSYLGGEAELYLGKEMERYVIDSPTSVVIPAKLPHIPLIITRVDKPFLLIDVRPFGLDMEQGKL